ncbi:MAG: extracellular solute-binding protein [Verrucomicrobia bacterium]|nr:extracellular solute-binding protein [Verrucomicrobiota bacterium]
MRRAPFLRGLLLLVVAYAAATYWVFTRSAPLVAARPVTLRFAHWQIERGPPDGLTAVIRRYEELHPRVRVEQVAVPSALYRQWLRTNLTGGTATDLIEFAYFLGGVDDVPARYFEPLTRYMDRPNPYNRGTALERVAWRQTFADGLFLMTSQSPEVGQIYGVTLSQGSLRLFCNRELLRRITGRTEGPKDFNAFRALCAQVAEYRRRTGRPVQPLAGSRSNARWLMEMLMQGCVAGMNLELDRDGLLSRNVTQSLEDYLQGRWTARRPELRAAYALLREVSQQMRPGFEQLGRDDAIQEFVRGEALFIFTGSYDATSLARLAPFPVAAMHVPQLTPDDPVVGPYIVGPYQEGLLGTGMEMYLNKDSRHKEEALDFLHFLTSWEGGKIFSAHSGWLSSIRGVPVAPEIEVQRATVNGYHTGTFYMGLGPNTALSFQQHLNQLVGPQGSVDRFVDALEADMRREAAADLRLDLRAKLTGARAIDSELAAVASLDRLEPATPGRAMRRSALASNQTLAELRAAEAAWILDHPAP